MGKKFNKYSNKKLSRGEPLNFSGQHFMHNKKILHQIIETAQVSKQDVVLELGAGKGALTAFLSEQAKKVIAVENDAKFVAFLKQKFESSSVTRIVQQDILQISLPRESFIVVANIPYAITTPIMKMLMSNPNNKFQRGAIVLEKGAAKRFTARSIRDPYVIAWRMWFNLRLVRLIGPQNFSPPPRVDSALLSMERKQNPLVPTKDYQIFSGLAKFMLHYPQLPADQVLRAIFSSPQMKMLKRNANFTGDTPVQSLSEQQWSTIFATMVKHVPSFRWPRVDERK